MFHSRMFLLKMAVNICRFERAILVFYKVINSLRLCNAQINWVVIVSSNVCLKYDDLLPVRPQGTNINWSNSQVPQCNCPISHNVRFCDRNVHMWHLYSSVIKWCIVQYFLMHYRICEMGLLFQPQKFNSFGAAARGTSHQAFSMVLTAQGKHVLVFW